MPTNREIMKALPLIASVLGNQYGLKVEMRGKHASTNGKTIILPAVSLDYTDTDIARVRGFVDHEAAHIRFTDFRMLEQANLNSLQRHLWNTLEDWRVEGRISEQFHGCRSNLDWLSHKLFSILPETADIKFSILNWFILKVRSWDVVSLQKNANKLKSKIDKVYPGLIPELEIVLEEARVKIRTSADVFNYVYQLENVIRNIKFKQEQEQAGEAQGKEDGQEQDKKATEFEGQGKATGQEKQGKGIQGKGKDKGTKCLGQEKQSINKVKELEELLQITEEQLPLDFAKTLIEKLPKALNEEDSLTVAIDSPKTLSPLVVSESMKLATMALRTRMQSLLQSHLLTPCILSRRGKINSNKLCKISVNNPTIFLKSGEKQKINTAVHILLDCSSSMHGDRIELASQACYALAHALQSIQVNVGVSVFPTSIDSHKNTICTVIKHGSCVNNLFNMDVSGTTPLAPALWRVLQLMINLQETRKIILVITDGEPDSVISVQKAIKTAESLDFEIYGVGILTDSIKALLPKTSCVISDINMLAPAMFNMLQQALLQRKRL